MCSRGHASGPDENRRSGHAQAAESEEVQTMPAGAVDVPLLRSKMLRALLFSKESQWNGVMCQMSVCTMDPN
jgi:hypothetical protein